MQTQFKYVNKMWELNESNSCSHLKDIWEQGSTIFHSCEGINDVYDTPPHSNII